MEYGVCIGKILKHIETMMFTTRRSPTFLVRLTAPPCVLPWVPGWRPGLGV